MDGVSVYIGNVNFDTPAESLESFVRDQGVVGLISINLKLGRDGGSRGWALADFNTADDANACVDRLNGLEIDGRALRVKLDRSPATFNSTEASDDRLYCGNLPWSVTDDALFALFQQYNPVSANVVCGNNGRSRGYGLISFNSSDEAQIAIDGVNGQDYDGRTLSVRLDGGSKRPANRGSGGGGGGGDNGPNTSIYVRNLPREMNWKGLKDLFQTLAPEFAQVKTGRGWGTVRFANVDDAQQAINLFNNYSVEGYGETCEIQVRFDNNAQY